MLTREQMAMRAAQEVEAGQSVRLGGGLAALCASQLPKPTSSDSAAEPHLDVMIVEAQEVAAGGEITLDANSGAAAQVLDAAQVAERVVVLMPHVGSDGQPRIRGRRQQGGSEPVCADRIITELGVIDVTPEGLVLRELAPGVSAADVQRQTEAPLLASATLRVIEV